MSAADRGWESRPSRDQDRPGVDARGAATSVIETSRATREAAIEAGNRALSSLLAAPRAAEDPLVVVALDRATEVERLDASMTLLDHYATRATSYGRENPRRYRWGLSWRAEPGNPIYVPAEPMSQTWRPAERGLLEADPSRYGRRLAEPVVLAAQLGHWGRLAFEHPDSELGRRAEALLAEAAPVMEYDIASWVLGVDPWRDTFGLWVLAEEPEALGRQRDLLFALAIRYGGSAARTGVVRGLKYPFHETPLVSGSAHLAAGLWRMGVFPTVIPGLLALIRDADHADGGWADGDQPKDVLTTLAAASVMARLAPDLDLGPTVDWFVRHQERGGWWRALGPEVPWLTSAVIDWLELAAMPFSQRFAWPLAPIWARDRLTGLTTMATLDELEQVLGRVPGLGDQTMEVAFLDLAQFGKWNTDHGQMRGDELLDVLGGSLRRLDGVLAVRIGGDEFLLLGKPSAIDLAERLEAWRQAWPLILQDSGMPTYVAPRILHGHGRVCELRDLRRRLGESIASLKQTHPAPSSTGVLKVLDS